MNSCVIVTGFCEKDPYLIKYINNDNIIAADSGYDICAYFGITPSVFIGDMDSVDENLYIKAEKILKYKKEKDDTDTGLSVKYAIENGYDDITVLGGLGGRLDHTVANMQTLLYIYRNGKRGRLLSSDTDLFLVKDGSLKLTEKYRYVSVFSANQKARGVSLKGFKYPLSNYTMINEYPIGVSNEPTDETCEVSVENGELFVICIK